MIKKCAGFPGETSAEYEATRCVVPGTKIPYVNWIQAWLVSLRAKRKKTTN